MAFNGTHKGPTGGFAHLLASISRALFAGLISSLLAVAYGLPFAPLGSRAEAGRNLVGQGIDPVCGRRSYQQKPAAAGSPIDEVQTLAALNLALALPARLSHDAKLD